MQYRYVYVGLAQARPNHMLSRAAPPRHTPSLLVVVLHDQRVIYSCLERIE